MNVQVDKDIPEDGDDEKIPVLEDDEEEEEEAEDEEEDDEE